MGKLKNVRKFNKYAEIFKLYFKNLPSALHSLLLENPVCVTALGKDILKDYSAFELVGTIYPVTITFHNC